MSSSNTEKIKIGRFDLKRLLGLLLFLSFIFLILTIGGNHASAAIPGDPSTGYMVNKNTPGVKLLAPAGSCGTTCDGFREAIAWLLYFIFTVVAALLGVAGILFDWVVKTDNVKFVLDNTAIYESWKMVRDMLNLAFILVLLFSAFCTIFQVEKYHLKNVLLRLVIMALLVNFSFPVARFIIDVSNVAFYFIVNSMLSGQSGKEISTGFAAFSEIAGIIEPKQISSSTNLTYLIAAIIFLFIFMITLLVIAVMFVIRLVALGVLIIFSPVGFVAAAFPSTKHYADDWWNNLFKYSFFAPLMIFMMAIALNILAIMNKDGNVITSFLKVAGDNIDSDSTDPSLFGSMAYFAIPIVILWFGLIAAQKMSIAGADLVVNKAKGIAKWPARMAGKGLKYAAVSGAKKFERDVLAPRGLSPRAFIEGWKQRAADVEKKVMGPAAGAWHDRLNKWFSRGEEKTRYRDAALQQNILKYQKEIADTSQDTEYLMSELESAKKTGNAQKVAAILRILYTNNDQNEFMKYYGLEVTPLGAKGKREVMHKTLRDAGMSEEDAAKQLSDLGEIAIAKGNYMDYGMGGFNSETGRYEKGDDSSQLAGSVAKFRNMKAQTVNDFWHWNSFFTETPDGKVGALHEGGEMQLWNLTQSIVDQMGRIRTDFADNMAQRLPELQTYVNNMNKINPDKAKTAQAFIDMIKKKSSGP